VFQAESFTKFVDGLKVKPLEEKEIVVNKIGSSEIKIRIG
jgi:hypothetical protein